ncbi:MAG: hypothetical protein GY906_30395 [bacterium]|nr:hypothetical protein [bacterium]
MDRNMSRVLMLALVTGLALGCGAQTAEQPAEEPVVEAVEVVEDVVEFVEVVAEGSAFDPPVAVAQIPEGVFYCPMETVHFASLEGGTCPTCGMDLVEKAITVEEEAAASEDPPA